MFRKKAKTPNTAAETKNENLTANSELPTLPTSNPKSPDLVIRKDFFVKPNSPPPEIKSVGLSLHAPEVNPQRAELNEPISDPDEGDLTPDGNNLRNSNENFTDSQEGDDGNNDVSPTNNRVSPQKMPQRSRTATAEPIDASHSNPLNKQLSAINEVSAMDERLPRPATAAIQLSNIEVIDKVLFEKESFQSKEELLEKITESGNVNSIRENSITFDSSPANQNSSPILPETKKKVVVPKKKLVQVDPPRKVNTTPKGTNKSNTAAIKDVEKITVKKSKLKVVEKTVSEAKKPNSKNEKEEIESIESSPEIQEPVAEANEFADTFSTPILPTTVYKQPTSKSLSPPQPQRRRLEEPKYRAEPLKSAKKVTTLKPLASQKLSTREPESEIFQRRIRAKLLANDGFSAMGLLDPENDSRPVTNSKSTSNRRVVANQPAPPPHYAAQAKKEEEHLKLKKRQLDLARNPSSRRKAIRSIAYRGSTALVAGLTDDENQGEIYTIHRFGHHDSDDWISKSIEQNDLYDKNGEQQQLLFQKRLGVRSEVDHYQNEHIVELEDTENFSRRDRSQYDENNSTSSQERYSDRIARKYNKAIRAAERDGMVSPEAVKYLTQYITQSAVEETNTTTTAKNSQLKPKISSTPKLYNSRSIMDDDETPPPPPESPIKKALITRATQKVQPPPKSRINASIMDDDFDTNKKSSVPPPKPKTVPKTRITIINKPSPSVSKKIPVTANTNPTVGTFWSQQPPQFAASYYPPAFGMMAHATLPSLSGHGGNALSQFGTLSSPTVPPHLMPARIRLTTIPVVTYKQSYIIEPTGHAPGTYLSPDEFGNSSSGDGMLTYISASCGGVFPSAIGENFVNPTVARGKSAAASAIPQKGLEKETVKKHSVRSMIKKGIIGRGNR
ncbi:hypothetical protein HK100_006452 [Physocladia obscura]|uniref:Uncharacterized protein n=1 Tax=Physocladia obscura TaxID=109957 RepID=A0AAD5TCS5_9FUNG|nr:hypothetical protein HK100_006452 [Physocladia obscura]